MMLNSASRQTFLKFVGIVKRTVSKFIRNAGFNMSQIGKAFSKNIKKSCRLLFHFASTNITKKGAMESGH